MARHDVLARRRELLQRLVALERVADDVGDREHAALVDVRVEMAGVGREHDVAALGLHPHALQALGVAADLVHGDAGRELVVAVVEFDAIGEHLRTIACTSLSLNGMRSIWWHMQRPVAVGHLGVLHVVARVREQVVIAGVVPVHVGGDDVLDLVGLDAERLQALADRM